MTISAAGMNYLFFFFDDDDGDDDDRCDASPFALLVTGVALCVRSC